MLTYILTGIGLLIGAFSGYVIAKKKIEKQLLITKQDAEHIIKNAEKEASEIKKKAVIESREELHRMREEWEKEKKEREEEIRYLEDRLMKREEMLSKREELLDKKESYIEEMRKELDAKQKDLIEKEKELTERFERLAGITPEQAKEMVLEEAREKYEYEIAKVYSQIKSRYEEDSEKYAKKVIADAIQRYAPEYAGEVTVSTIMLPNDDMKGRLIGREGRNIRAFEKVTGVDLIIDDTPEMVTVSCFNPLRREIARRTIEKLVADGRIHPTRIEEMYEKSKSEVEKVIREAGQEATFVTGVGGLHPEVIKLLGRLKFRTSYGQNVLNHSIEVALIAGLIASELGVNVEKAKRGGLLHDIGKALDHEVEGSHTVIGAEILKRYGESREIINMVMAHHGEEEPMTPEAVIVAAADALSAARPGARREDVENYIKRLIKLEEIAKSFKYVENAYAIQAGREVRVIVQPDKIDDALADKLSHDIAIKIEEELQYPGVLKVVVIREKRSVAYAK
ncbi:MULTISPECIES: ribonuclease Y [Thermosipho]|uniref:Ribonuclease Y n=1 Tax=Thermosipho affectus TaxID=660294 RepID=A0ABX3IK86_9BACT|nr:MULTISPECIES: ribonuclease Y [Thermosipho]ANQ54085.1 ribonuclease [Thermosipho sp. 1070]APT72530.1 ribonuclease [Thermosipho sp. 1063]MBT1248230.1 ribonuclease Y [Thermosipho sp. 1244]ONN26952.1 ribonuclease [Thermosipho affectus]OOC42709.1 ribonuclease [Thermosipho sp. 1074]